MGSSVRPCQAVSGALTSSHVPISRPPPAMPRPRPPPRDRLPPDLETAGDLGSAHQPVTVGTLAVGHARIMAYLTTCNRCHAHEKAPFRGLARSSPSPTARSPPG